MSQAAPARGEAGAAASAFIALLHTLRQGSAPASPEIAAAFSALDAVGDDALGAFAMAVCLRGLDHAATVALTRSMRDSGRVLDWRGHALRGPLLDKHSTGGVGDLVSLVLAPALAACGAHVPMLSGGALGHSGGTLDKLAAIPGYVSMPGVERFQRVVADTGLAIAAASEALAPADHRLYAVRDRTGTVDCMPLIVSSILSKKLAAGVDALVLDVKCGNGALLAPAVARPLAQALVQVAADCGLRCAALVTDMAQPLADCAGDGLELGAAIALLRGDTRDARARALVLALGARALVLGGVEDDTTRAVLRLEQALDSGRAAERFGAMVAALGGPAGLVERPGRYLPRAPVVRPVPAERAGWVGAIDTAAIGRLARALGAGGPQGDRAVGLARIVRIGDSLGRDDPLALVHARSEDDWQRAAHALRASVRLCSRPPLRCAALVHETTLPTDDAAVPSRARHAAGA